MARFPRWTTLTENCIADCSWRYSTPFVAASGGRAVLECVVAAVVGERRNSVWIWIAWRRSVRALVSFGRTAEDGTRLAARFRRELGVRLILRAKLVENKERNRFSPSARNLGHGRERRHARHPRSARAARHGHQDAEPEAPRESRIPHSYHV